MISKFLKILDLTVGQNNFGNKIPLMVEIVFCKDIVCTSNIFLEIPSRIVDLTFYVCAARQKLTILFGEIL